MNNNDGNKLPTVGFLILDSLSLSEFMTLAELLVAQRRARSILIVSKELESIVREYCSKTGLDHVALPFHLPKEITGNDFSLLEKGVRKLWGWSGGRPFARRRYRIELEYQLEHARNILELLELEHLVLPRGRNRRWELAFIKIANELGARTIVPNLAYPGLPDDLTQVRNSGDYLGRYNLRLSEKFPSQFAFDQGKKDQVSYYPAYMLEEAAAKGVLPSNPWIPGGNICDVVMASGEEEKKTILAHGAQAQRVVVTGQRSHDTLYENASHRSALRRQLFEKYGLPAEDRLVIAAMPQYGEHGILPWQKHWQEVRFLCKILRENEAACLVSLHPRMDPSNYKWVTEEYGLEVAGQRLSEILPAADVFIAGLSSTLEWAVLCGVPAVAMSFIGPSFDYFDKFNGVRMIKKRGDLAGILKRLTDDNRHRQEAAHAQLEWRHRLSPFDGGCTQRILDSIVGN